MNKKNKKLQLNKQIISNLDEITNLNDIKGGGLLTRGKWCRIIVDTIIETVLYSVEQCFSGDPKGICQTDVCTFVCETNGCGGGTEYVSCYGGSCAKCG